MDYAQLPSSREHRSEEPSCSLEKSTTSTDKEAARECSSADVDPGLPTPRSDHMESEVDEQDRFEHPSEHLDVDTKQEKQRENLEIETSANVANESGEFPGCSYLDSNDLNRLGVGGSSNNSNSHMDVLDTEDVERSSRSRKRKQMDTDPSKSPKSRPGSTASSSLEVLSLDNGNYLPSENGNGQLRLPESSQGDDSLPQQLEQPNSVESNHNPPDKTEKSANVTRPWTRSPVSLPSPVDPPYQQHLQDDVSNMKNGAHSNTGNSMSVRELEDAMNRHLPHDNSSPGPSPEVLMLKSYATTSSESNAQHGHHPRSSIQWISGTAPAPLPATSLLRQIYVSRESVIRSGAHASRSSGGSCYGGDVHQGTLPTPPGGQGEPAYGDTAQLMLQSAAKLSAADAAAAYGVISGFASGGYVDTCNAMTPPSSVSPRDKFNSDAASAFNEAAAVAAAAAIPHMRHYVTTDPNSLQHLPLKHPQLFVHPGNLDHHHSSYGHPQQTLSPDQHQLYHPTPGGSKPSLHATNGSSWFCQPHS